MHKYTKQKTVQRATKETTWAERCKNRRYRGAKNHLYRRKHGNELAKGHL